MEPISSAAIWQADFLSCARRQIDRELLTVAAGTYSLGARSFSDSHRVCETRPVE
jgi:hypothetical protein